MAYAGAGGVGLCGGIAGVLGHGTGLGGQAGGNTGFQQGIGNLAHAQVQAAVPPIPLAVGVATVSPWASDQHSSDISGSKQA